MPRFIVVSLALLVSACGAVQSARIRPDFEQVDKTQTLRLTVLTTPFPGEKKDVAKMWSRMARRYINHHRDYIARKDLATQTHPDSLCADDTEGVVTLLPEAFKREGGEVEVVIKARLYRCRDGEDIWSASAGGVFSEQDSNVRELIQEYMEEFGPGVFPYIAPSFHVLRQLLDTLPYPKMPNDDYVLEKIDLAD